MTDCVNSTGRVSAKSRPWAAVCEPWLLAYRPGLWLLLTSFVTTVICGSLWLPKRRG